MTEKAEPRIETLRAHLERGIAPGTGAPDVRRELGMPGAATDAEVARSLVQILSAVQLASLGPSREAPGDAGPPSTGGIALPTDASFLGQLAVSSAPLAPAAKGASEGPLGVDELDDPRTLVCVLRAGSLRQRRAAARRLTQLLRSTESIDAASEVDREIRDLREPALEHELRALRAELPGGPREGAEDDPPFAPSLAHLERAIGHFWDGETVDEPLAATTRDVRALLLHRVRELPDAVVRHVAAVIEGDDGTSSLAARREVITLCRHAGDARLLPALASVVAAGPPELRVDAARTLAEIEDPRARPALRAAYERSVDERERVELAGALGAAGDLRGRAFVRALLVRDDRDLRVAALRALEHLGDTADVDAILEGLAQRAERREKALAWDDERGARAPRADLEDEEAWQTVRTLGRIGDGRALAALGALYTRTRIPGLRAEIEDAEAAIRARMEVRGEALGERVTLARAPDPDDDAPPAHDAPVTHRLRGLLDYVVGHVLLALGAVRSGVARLERAAERRPRWGTPWVSIAMAWSSRGQYAAALGAFRRALSADRERLERNPIVVRALARAFLRRAEEVERDGRLEIARGLLGEALAFDLRRAPSTLRFELKRQHELLSRRSAG